MILLGLFGIFGADSAVSVVWSDCGVVGAMAGVACAFAGVAWAFAAGFASDSM